MSKKFSQIFSIWLKGTPICTFADIKYLVADRDCMPMYDHLAEYLDSYKSAPAKAVCVPSVGSNLTHTPRLNTWICELTPEEKASHDRTVLLGRLLPGLCSFVLVKWSPCRV